MSSRNILFKNCNIVSIGTVYREFDSEGTERFIIKIIFISKPRINRLRNSRLIESCTLDNISNIKSIVESIALN